MTKKAGKDAKKHKPRPKLTKEELSDLDAKHQGEGVKGGQYCKETSPIGDRR